MTRFVYMIAAGLVPVAFVAAFAFPAAAQSISNLDVPDGFLRAYAYAFNGSAAVGYALRPTDPDRATKWNAETGEVELLGEVDNGNGAFANAVSADGSIVVGVELDSSFRPQPIRWHGTGTGEYLTQIGGGGGALDISADGSIIVGWGLGFVDNVPVRWDALGTPQQLALSSGMIGGQATAVSGDGLVTAGNLWDDASEYPHDTRAVVWTADGQVAELELLAPGGMSEVSDVNVDGSVIVGGAVNAGSQMEGVRWTSDGVQGLGTIEGMSGSYGNATNADGSVIVGYSGDQAMRWTEDDGMLSVYDVLLENGVDMSEWTLWQATDVSDDGETILGWGYGPTDQLTGWIARDIGLVTIDGIEKSIGGLGLVATPTARG